MFHTYVYYDPRTGFPIYVGKGKGKRYKAHYKGCSHNKRFNNILLNIISEGYVPIITRVLIDVTNEEATAEEIRLISHFGRLGLDENGILMNYTLGGEGNSGYKRSKTSIEQGASKQRGVKRPQVSFNISRGTKLAMEDLEIRKKISAKRKNVPCPQITKDKLRALFSKTRLGIGNPSSKKWQLINPNGQEIITADLAGFCRDNDLSYVGLKAAYRNNRPVMRGCSKGWMLSIIK